jgi:hypothetical protein
MVNFSRMYIYGKQYAELSYLPDLQVGRVELVEIPQTENPPTYPNPAAIWTAIERCIVQAESSWADA